MPVSVSAIDDGVEGGLVQQANARARQLFGALTEARLRVRLDERDHPVRASSRRVTDGPLRLPGDIKHLEWLLDRWSRQPDVGVE